MPLSDIANVIVNVASGGITQAGFGIPMILSASTPIASFPERVRYYTSLTGFAVDYGPDMPEFKAAQRIFGQSPRVQRLAVGRLLNKPMQRWKMTVTTVLDNTNYNLRIGDDTVTVLSDGTALNDEIVDAFVTGINLLTAAVTASAQGSVGSKYVQILADAAGTWFDVEILDSTGNTGASAAAMLGLAQDHADPGVAEDLDDLAVESNLWYGIINPWNSKAMVMEIAAWAEANKKLFLAATQDTASVTAAVGGTDVGDDLKDAAYARTSAWYHPSNGAFLDAGVMGKLFPKPPGSAAYFYKTIAGVPAYTLTATHKANLDAKYMNYYRTEAGRNITDRGIVASNEWIDIIVGLDQLEAWIQQDVALLEFNSDKIPFTDPGIASIQSVLIAVTKRAVRQSILAADPPPEVTVPLAKDVSAADKAARHLPDVFLIGTLAGAIHDLTVTVNVTP